MFRRIPLSAPFGHQVEARQTGAVGQIPPLVSETRHFGNCQRAVDIKERLPVHPYVSLVSECLEHSIEGCFVIGCTRIGLLDQDSVRSSMPDSRTCLIRPSEAEGKLWLSRLEHLGEGALEDLSPREPIVPIAEGLDAVSLRHFRLGCSCFRQTEVVEPEVGGHVRLVVPTEHRQRLAHISPLRKTSSPPFVILWNRMELGQVERNHAGSWNLHQMEP